MERFAREYNYPVFFVELIRTKRGYYTMTFEEIANPPYEELEKGAIVERFARRLENQLKIILISIYGRINVGNIRNPPIFK